MKKFDVVLLEKPGCEGLNKDEVVSLYNKLSVPESFPVEIGGMNSESSAMGFITPEAAEKLNYEYGPGSQFAYFISSILDDMDNESDDGSYEFDDIKVWLTRNCCTDTIKLMLICPECGNIGWIRRDDKDGAFECAACGELVLPEDMPARASDEEVSA